MTRRDCTCAGIAVGYPQHEHFCGKPEDEPQVEKVAAWVQLSPEEYERRVAEDRWLVQNVIQPELDRIMRRTEGGTDD